MSDAVLCFISEAIAASSTELALLGFSVLGWAVFAGFDAFRPEALHDKSLELNAEVKFVAQAAIAAHIAAGDSSEASRLADRHGLSCVAPTSADSTAEESPSALVSGLAGLPSDLAANIFLFTELTDVLQCAGSTCQTLQKSVWQEPNFWKAMGGSAFVEALDAGSLQTSTAVPVSEAFRRWVFRIEGAWTHELEKMAVGASPAEVLRQALGFAQGLRTGDAEAADLWRLVKIATTAMQRANAWEKGSLATASEVAIACLGSDVFDEEQQDLLSQELTAFEARVKVDELSALADKDAELDAWASRWGIAEEPHPVDSSAISSQAGDMLSLAFLAAMQQ